MHRKFANILGCKTGEMPALYLGLPLSSRRITKSMWNLVVERVEKKLPVWKTQYLSIGGRVTLIKSVLSNLPVYYFCLFKCLASIIKRLEGLEREFL